VFCPALWARSSRWLAALAVLCGCHRAEIDLPALLDGAAGAGPPSSGGTHGDAIADVAGQGGDGAAGEASPDSAAGGGAGATNRYDEIALQLCRDALEPVQRACLLVPDARTCSDSGGPSWQGCAGACEVCEEQLVEYPHYLEWHPCCERKACGDHVARRCHEHCPPPATRDKVKPCPEQSD
jgi:hypothetical protein